VTELPIQVLRTVPSDPWWKQRAGWIYAAIVDGELRDHDQRDDVRYGVTCESIGMLPLPGGQLIAADPYVMEAEPKPFVQQLGTDLVEAIAARATIAKGHERIAVLILKAGSNLIHEWVMATLPGQDVSALDAEGFFGYPVDAGTGSFGGPEAMKVAGRVLQADAGMLDDPMSKALFSDGVGTRSAVLVAPEDGATPVAVCSSGWGDGQYPTWLGLDDSGHVMVAVTDFLLTGDPYASPLPEEPAAPQEPPSRKKSRLRRWFRR
jgi:hypothetical protein